MGLVLGRLMLIGNEKNCSKWLKQKNEKSNPLYIESGESLCELWKSSAKDILPPISLHTPKAPNPPQTVPPTRLSVATHMFNVPYFEFM